MSNVSRAPLGRRIRFWMLQHLLLPVAVLPVKLWVRTWRMTILPEADALAELAREPRIVLVTYHGMMLHLLGAIPLLARHNRRLVVMTSPSRDGKLLAALLARFGIGHVEGSSKSRAVVGSLEFIDALRTEGRLGLIAVDGPRGPCCVAKPGAQRIAEAADARLIAAVSTASSGHRFGSWDRAHLPWPLARVTVRFEPVAFHDDDESAAAAMQRSMLAYARELDSPVLPPGAGLGEAPRP